MSGLRTNTKDLGKSASKFLGAMQGEETRKKAAIKELTRRNIAQGMSQERARLEALNEYYNEKLKWTV